MEIRHFNTTLSGGSSVLMMRLHDTLRRMGHDSRVRFRVGSTEVPEALRVDYCSGGLDRFLERARYSLENRLVGADPASYFSRLKLHRATTIPAADLVADIIHLHWVGRWLDLPSFLESVPRTIPIVWTIHDMSPLAGGCFLDFGCGEYGNGCKRCPLLKMPFDRFLASGELRRRQKALAGRNVVAVANSASTARLIERSQLFSNIDIHTIYPGVDFSKLPRYDMLEARRMLGITQGRLILGFGAASLTDRNKGIDRFFEVAARVFESHKDTELVIFGDGDPHCPIEGLPVRHLGKLTSPEQLAVAMSAMDAFVITSQMETFGQVAVEAQACGTPVWAFSVGGLSETLDPGVTGGLVPFAETGKMAAEILECFASGRLREMGEAGAAWVRNRFSNEDACRQYVGVYRKLLAQAGQRPTNLNSLTP